MHSFASFLKNFFTGLSFILLITALFFACARKSSDVGSGSELSGIVSVLPGSEMLPKMDVFTLTIVGTVDGNIHAVDHNYNLLWTSSTGGPLARGTAIKSSPEEENAEYVIPTLDGTLLLHNTARGMRKTSLSARLLAEKTPFVSGEGMALTGSKEDKIFGLDLTSGNSLFERQEAIVKLPTKTSLSAPKSVTKKRPIPIFFGREDFIFRGIDALTGSEKFTFSYAEIFPLSEKNKISISTQDSFQSENRNNENLDDLQDGEVSSHEQILSTPEGYVFFLDKFGDILNNDFPVSLQSPAVAAFRVLIRDGEAIQTKRVPIKHSLHQLHNYLRLRQTKTLPSSLMSTTSKPNKATDDEQSKLLAQSSVFPTPNMVIVQGEMNEGVQENNYLYAMEIIVPSEVPSSVSDDKFYLPVSPSQVIHASLETNHDSDSNNLNIDKKDGRIENFEIDDANTLLLECDAILEAEKSEKWGKSSSSISKTRLNMNIRHSRKPFVPSTNNNNQQLTAEELRSKCYELKKHHSQVLDDGNSVSSENDKEWLSLDKYLLEYDAKFSDKVASSPAKVNRIRGLHKLTINEPNEEFWLPKIHKDLQRHVSVQRKIFSPSFTSTNSNLDAVNSKLNHSFLNQHLTSFISIFSSFITFVFIFFLLILLFIVGYFIQLPPNAKIGEQSDIARFFIPYLCVHFPIIRSILVHYFVDLEQLLSTKNFYRDNKSKQLSSHSDTVLAATRPNHVNIVSESLDEKGRKVLKVGSLRVYEAVLGVGSHGTVVFVGTLHARPVAVKRMLKMLHRTAEREMSLLIKSDGHPNVVRYFIKEECNDFIYLGLQLCVMSVKDFVLRLRHHILKNTSNLSDIKSLEELLDDPYGCFLNLDDEAQPESDKDQQSSETKPAISTNKCEISDEVRCSLLQVAQGLSFLHSQRILHRDLKPHNILLSPPNEFAVNKDEALSGHFRSQYFADEDNKSMTDNNNLLNNNKIIGKYNVSNTEKEKKNAKIVHLSQLGEFVLKISDMGLSKQLLDHSDSSFSRSAASLSLLSISSKKRVISNQKLPKKDKNNDNHNDSIALVDREVDEEASLFQDEVGTIGWQAPEIVLQHRHKHTISESIATDKNESDERIILDNAQNESIFSERDKNDKDKGTTNNREKQLKADIFSLGCVFYYVLSLGGHPFGAWYEREQNIIQNNCNLSLFDEHCPEISDLLAEMLQTNVSERPTATHVAQHPFFWSAAKRLEFLTDFSDAVEKLSPDSPALLSLEAQGHFRLSQKQQTHSNSVFRGSWDRFIDAQLLQDGGKYRRYDARSVKDLLRLIRNKKHHFLELSVGLRETLGNVPQGYLRYFESRFPRLLLHCVRVAVQHLQEDKLMNRWMENLHINPMYITQINQNTANGSISHKSSGKESISNSQLSALSPSFIPSSLPIVNTTESEAIISTFNPSSISNEIEKNEDNTKEFNFSDIGNTVENDTVSETLKIDVENDIVDIPRDTGVVMVVENENESDEKAKENNAIVTREMSVQWETQGVVVWRGSSLEQTLPPQCRRGWLRDTSDWMTHGLRPGQQSSTSTKRPQRLTRQTTDLKYRSRLCSHWEVSGGTLCPMRKRGKCAFAHSPLELRVKENRRDKWPATHNNPNVVSGDTNYENYVSGGEDVLTAARHSDPAILALYKSPSFPVTQQSMSAMDPPPHIPPTLSSVVSNIHHYPFPANYAPPSMSYRVPENLRQHQHFSPSRTSTVHNYHSTHTTNYRYIDNHHQQYNNSSYGYSEITSDNNNAVYPHPYPPVHSNHNDHLYNNNSHNLDDEG